MWRLGKELSCETMFVCLSVCRRMYERIFKILYLALVLNVECAYVLAVAHFSDIRAHMGINKYE